MDQSFSCIVNGIRLKMHARLGAVMDAIANDNLTPQLILILVELQHVHLSYILQLMNNFCDEHLFSYFLHHFSHQRFVKKKKES